MSNEKENKEEVRLFLRRFLYNLREKQNQIRSMAIDFKHERFSAKNLAKQFGLEEDGDIKMYLEVTDESKELKYIQDFKLEGREHSFLSCDGLREVGIDFKEDIRTIQGAVERLIKLVDPSADLY